MDTVAYFIESLSYGVMNMQGVIGLLDFATFTGGSDPASMSYVVILKFESSRSSFDCKASRLLQTLPTKLYTL